MVDERRLLLEEVNFKWLMAGQGWWVNLPLFHSDMCYAAHCLRLAGESESTQLKKCAAVLEQAQSCIGA